MDDDEIDLDWSMDQEEQTYALTQLSVELQDLTTSTCVSNRGRSLNKTALQLLDKRIDGNDIEVDNQTIDNKEQTHAR